MIGLVCSFRLVVFVSCTARRLCREAVNGWGASLRWALRACVWFGRIEVERAPWNLLVAVAVAGRYDHVIAKLPMTAYENQHSVTSVHQYVINVNVNQYIN